MLSCKPDNCTDKVASYVTPQTIPGFFVMGMAATVYVFTAILAQRYPQVDQEDDYMNFSFLTKMIAMAHFSYAALRAAINVKNAPYIVEGNNNDDAVASAKKGYWKLSGSALLSAIAFAALCSVKGHDWGIILRVLSPFMNAMTEFLSIGYTKVIPNNFASANGMFKPAPAYAGGDAGVYVPLNSQQLQQQQPQQQQQQVPLVSMSMSPSKQNS